MFNVLIIQKVQDYAKWKPFYEGASAKRQEYGAKEAHLYRNSDDPNEVVILFEWDNTEKARKYFESDYLLEKLKEAGAEMKTKIFLEEAVEWL